MNETLKTALIDGISHAQSPNGMATKIVAIDGGGAAGKSTLAKQLSQWLGDVPVVNTDDFASPDIPLDWSPRLLEQVLSPLSHNQPAHYQRYDWKKLELGEWCDIESGGTIILEGVFSLRHQFQPYLAYRIWVETPRALRLERGMNRERGILGEKEQDRWLGWQAAEDEYFKLEQPESTADMVVNAKTENYHHEAKK